MFNTIRTVSDLSQDRESSSISFLTFPVPTGPLHQEVERDLDGDEKGPLSPSPVNRRLFALRQSPY